jgi:hypothetical protein
MHISKNNFSLLFCNGVIAQQHWDIEGRFPQAANQEILLKGFNMQGDSPLSTTTSDERVRFTCSTRHCMWLLLEIKSSKNLLYS